MLCDTKLMLCDTKLMLCDTKLMLYDAKFMSYDAKLMSYKHKFAFCGEQTLMQQIQSGFNHTINHVRSEIL
jgi:hypothetical protein